MNLPTSDTTDRPVVLDPLGGLVGLSPDTEAETVAERVWAPDTHGWFPLISPAGGAESFFSEPWADPEPGSDGLSKIQFGLIFWCHRQLDVVGLEDFELAHGVEEYLRRVFTEADYQLVPRSGHRYEELVDL